MTAASPCGLGSVNLKDRPAWSESHAPLGGVTFEQAIHALSSRPQTVVISALHLTEWFWIDGAKDMPNDLMIQAYRRISEQSRTDSAI